MADTGGGGGSGRGDHPPPPLVAENCVCSNSNFSPTQAITPDHPPPLVVITPPPPPSENPVSAPDTVILLEKGGFICLIYTYMVHIYSFLG